MSDILELLFLFAVGAVIAGHIFFAYGQWFKWPKLAKKMTDLKGDAVSASIPLGRSFASYNASIAAGLLLSFRLDSEAQYWTQTTVLALIVATAAVGASGMKTNTVLLFRLLPALIALLLRLSF